MTSDAATTALAALETLPVKGGHQDRLRPSAFRSGVVRRRDLRGGHNGCDTRNDIRVAIWSISPSNRIEQLHGPDGNPRRRVHGQDHRVRSGRGHVERRAGRSRRRVVRRLAEGAPAAGRGRPAATWRTTRAISRPSTVPPMGRRATETLRRGCHRTRLTAARTCPAGRGESRVRAVGDPGREDAIAGFSASSATAARLPSEPHRRVHCRRPLRRRPRRRSPPPPTAGTGTGARGGAVAPRAETVYYANCAAARAAAPPRSTPGSPVTAASSTATTTGSPASSVEPDAPT